MPWYVTSPDWGLHWTGPQRQHDPRQLNDAGLPDIWSHFHPLIGVYDSADSGVIECHLLQMKLAGIDGVIVDWYGLSDAADYGQIHKACQEVFRAAQKYDMQFAVCFEDRTIERLVRSGQLAATGVPEHLTETLRWANENWFAAPHYVHLDERPLLLNFGPVFVKDGNVWNSALSGLSERPRLFALDHLWKEVGADGGFAWVYPEVWQENDSTDKIDTALTAKYAAISADSTKVIAAALPGFDDVYAKSYPTIPYRNGATLRESLSCALRGPWPVVQLVTWNDYGEGTMIEPTHEFGYRFLEIVQQARREDLGPAFVFGGEDLRLPAQLYSLRQSAADQKTELDRIAGLLSRGETVEARAALHDLTGSYHREVAQHTAGRTAVARSDVFLLCSQ